MRIACFSFLLLLILASCGTTDFQRQKYTDFGHVKGMRYREAAAKVEHIPEQVTEKLLREETRSEEIHENPLQSDAAQVVDSEASIVSVCTENTVDSLVAEVVVPGEETVFNATIRPDEKEAKRIDPDASKRRVRKLSAVGYLLFALDIALYLLLAGSGSAFVILLLLGVLFLSICFLFSAHSEGKRYVRAAERGEFKEDPRVRKMSNRAAIWGVVFMIVLIAGLFGMLLLAGASYS